MPKRHYEPSRSEHEMYHWLLCQRLLHDAGLLPANKVAQLTELGDWMGSFDDFEAAHALTCESGDKELHEAFEAWWWNATGKAGIPLTFAEIRAKAAMEA